MFYLPPDTPSDLLQHRKKSKPQDGVKPEYTVMKEEDFPDKVKELIEENKESEFQLTYQDGSYLYLLKGYGKQETGDTVSKLRTCPSGQCHPSTDYPNRAGRGQRSKRRAILSISGGKNEISGRTGNF